MKLIRLQEQYNNYKKEFYKTAKHPHPSELLALLLLPEKDNFQPVSGNSREFYEYYEEKIKEKIDQVIVDFNITKKGVFCTSFFVIKWGESFETKRYYWNYRKKLSALSCLWLG